MKIIQPSIDQILQYKCIFFDFDGVVLESGDIKTDAFVELYQGLGIDHQVRGHHLNNQGISRFEKFKWISENLLNEVYTEAAGKALGEKFSGLVRKKVSEAPFVEGYLPMIQTISKNGIYCVVASGTPETELKSIIEERSLGRYFQEIHGSPKKKEGIVNQVLKNRDFAPEECLFFGDASTDYEAAKHTGVDFYARLSDELSTFWTNSEYEFGTFNFSGVFNQ